MKIYIKIALPVIIVGFVVSLFYFRQGIGSYVVMAIERPSGFLFSRISFLSSFVAKIGTINSLTKENISLHDENTSLLARLALQADIGDENEFLRKALDLPMLRGHKFINAGVFNVSLTPDSHRLLVNRGSKDNIEKDSVVMLASGVLVGRIIEVFDNYSVLAMVSDPNFKVTIKILGTNTTGILKGNLQEGSLIDFISQNDVIKEGDIVITTGNDLFPPGLIVGSVSHISADDGSVFKKIEVKTMIDDSNISRVLIITE